MALLRADIAGGGGGGGGGNGEPEVKSTSGSVVLMNIIARQVTEASAAKSFRRRLGQRIGPVQASARKRAAKMR